MSNRFGVVGDVIPVDNIQVIKKFKEDLLKDYPYTATQLADKIKRKLPDVPRNKVWDAIAENGLKTNTDYSVFVFSSNVKRARYEETGDSGFAPSIYNQRAIDFLLNVLKKR